MTAMVSSFKGRFLKDKHYHKFIQPYIVVSQKFTKKPFAFKKIQDAIIKDKSYIERLTIKIENFDNITFNVVFSEPQYFATVESVKAKIELECKKEIWETIQENKKFALAYKEKTI